MFSHFEINYRTADPALAIDFYKADHRRQYPDGTTEVYSNFTARSSKLAKMLPDFDNKVVFFGLQYCITKLYRDWEMNFFRKPLDEVLFRYKSRMDSALGTDVIQLDHIKALHNLGYLPIQILALPEGTRVPIGVPMLTIKNTEPEFFWLTNYLETILSCTLWKPITVATIAFEFKKLLTKYAIKTGSDLNFVNFQAHDFSFRGMSGLEDAAICGAAHLTSFMGTDTVPAIELIEDYYSPEGETVFIGGSVPACYDDETEVLTESGWKRFKDLSENLKVAQYHLDGSVDFVIPSASYNLPYKGDMIKWSKEGYGYVDMLVTPNHKMVRINQATGEINLFEAGDFSYRNRNGFSSRNYLPVSGYTHNVGIRLSVIEKLKIAFQADGAFPSRKDAYVSGQVRFNLKKSRKVERLTELLNESGFKFTKTKLKNGYHDFWITPPTPNTFQKDFQWVVLDKSIEWYWDFLNELQYWDGRKVNNCIVYSSTTRKCIDMVQAICSLCGYKSHFHEYIDTREDHIRKANFSLTIQNKQKISGESITRQIVQYDGHVYCVTVPSKMLIIRRNNIVSICGNTEHSVMCAGTQEDELETFTRLITDVYPKGIVSIVSDTWDFWKVVTKYLPALKDLIMARDGKVVIRPDSGDPVKIICGDKYTSLVWGVLEVPEFYGVVEVLWKIFGGTINEKGYKVLDPHIGVIYGDSITLEIANTILQRLEENGFASSNIVFGIGSYSYQYITRDTFGMAMKATSVVVNGERRAISKNPKTDDGTKKSAKGVLNVIEVDGELKLIDEDNVHTVDMSREHCLLKSAIGFGFWDKVTLHHIRKRLNAELESD